MIWRIPGISLNLHYPKEDDGELYTACPIIKGSRGIEPLNPLPQRRIRLTLPAYLCLKTALRRSEIREYYNLWLIDFIEKRGLLNGSKKKKIALYSVFGPHWIRYFDNADTRIFVERENLHKPHFEGFLHRYLEDEKFSLSLGFDKIDHPQYMRFPFWLMWTIFPATVSYEDVKYFVDKANNIQPNPKRIKFCAYVCSHDDLNRKQIYEEFNAIAPLSCPGKLFHNDDSLKTKFNDDKRYCFFECV